MPACCLPQAEGCKKYRVYGFDGKPAVCCATHKKPGMVDVRSSRCEFDKCFRHPSFGYKWEKKRRFCGRHKLPDMMDVRSRNQPQVGFVYCCCVCSPVLDLSVSRFVRSAA